MTPSGREGTSLCADGQRFSTMDAPTVEAAEPIWTNPISIWANSNWAENDPKSGRLFPALDLH